MAFQSPTNAKLADYTGHVQATATSFVAGSFVLGVMTIVLGMRQMETTSQAILWLLLGGFPSHKDFPSWYPEMPLFLKSDTDFPVLALKNRIAHISSNVQTSSLI